MFNAEGTLYFFFDYISHNAWLAWHDVHALVKKHGLKLEPVPVVFGAMLSAYNQVGPAELPVKGRWMLTNVLRKAKLRGIPIAPPFSHPFNPLLALRVSCAELPENKKRELIDRMFRATWVQSRAMHEPAVIAEVIGEAGLDAQQLLAQAAAETVKLRLRQNTDDALRAGIFGVPSLLVGGQLFWGYDDFEHLERFLSGADPLGNDPAVFAPWSSIKPSAQRKR